MLMTPLHNWRNCSQKNKFLTANHISTTQLVLRYKRIYLPSFTYPSTVFIYPYNFQWKILHPYYFSHLCRTNSPIYILLYSQIFFSKAIYTIDYYTRRLFILRIFHIRYYTGGIREPLVRVICKGFINTYRCCRRNFMLIFHNQRSTCPFPSQVTVILIVVKRKLFESSLPTTFSLFLSLEIYVYLPYPRSIHVYIIRSHFQTKRKAIAFKSTTELDCHLFQHASLRPWMRVACQLYAEVKNASIVLRAGSDNEFVPIKADFLPFDDPSTPTHATTLLDHPNVISFVYMHMPSV